MNKSVTALCVVFVMLGIAFMMITAAQTGTSALVEYDADVAEIEDLGEYEYLGQKYTVVRHGASWFYNGLDAKRVIFDSSISTNGFEGCSFEHIVFTSNVLTVGAGAFKDSSKLHSIASWGRTTVESSAFSGCDSLEYVDFRLVNYNDGAFDVGSDFCTVLSSDSPTPTFNHSGEIRFTNSNFDSLSIGFDGMSMFVLHPGEGMLRMFDQNGTRSDFSMTVVDGGRLYEFNHSGGDASIDYAQIFLDYSPYDLADATVTVNSDTINLKDPTNGNEKSKANWKGWKVESADSLVGLTMSVDQLTEFGHPESVRLIPVSNQFTITYVARNSPDNPSGNVYSRVVSAGDVYEHRYSGSYHVQYWVDGNGGHHNPYTTIWRLYSDQIKAPSSSWMRISKDSYNVIYYDCDGTVHDVTEKKAYGSSITLSRTAPRDVPDNYDFVGWKSKGSNAVLKPGESYTAYGYLNFEPVIEEKPKYDITLTNGDDTTTTNLYRDLYYTIELDDPEDPEGTDRIFIGWADSKGNSYSKGDSILIKGAVSLTSSWKVRDTYAITFLDRGEFISRMFVLEGKTTDITISLERENYVHSGWEGGGKTYAIGDSTVFEGSTDLNAVWTAGDSTITYRCMYGDVVRSCLIGEYIEISCDPGEKEGYTFDGWTVDGAIVEGITVQGVIEAIPSWTPIKCKVTYHALEGDETRYASYDGTITIFCDPGVKEGYYLDGWSDGESTISNGGTYVIKGDVEFTPVWSNEGCSITYVCVDGTVTKKYPGGTTITIDCDPGKLNGYEFSGWEIGGKAYQNGESTTISGSMELLPIWTKAQDGSGDSDSGSGSGGSDSSGSDTGGSDKRPSSTVDADDGADSSNGSLTYVIGVMAIAVVSVMILVNRRS